MSTESQHLSARLTSLASMLDAGTITHLDEFGVGPGWNCLEVGAGSGSIAAWLSDRVAPSGHVTAVDLYPELLDHLSHPNLESKRWDITSDEDLPGRYDLIHARWMLHWLPDPLRVLQRLSSALTPGGVLFVEEPDFVSLIHGARSPALSRVVAAGAALGAGLTGTDNFYGRELPAQVGTLGLVDTGCAGRVGMLYGARPETGTDWLRLSIEWIAPKLLEAESVSTEDIDEFFARLADPSFMTPAPITIAAWGRQG